MSGKPIISREKVLELVRQGVGTKEIATEHWKEISLDKRRTKPFNRYSILYVIRNAKKEGLLPGGERKPSDQNKVVKQLSSPEKIGMDIMKSLSSEQLDNVTIRVLQWAYQYPDLMEQNKGLLNQLISAKERIKQLEEKLKNTETRKMAIEAAKKGTLVTHGD